MLKTKYVLKQNTSCSQRVWKLNGNSALWPWFTGIDIDCAGRRVTHRTVGGRGAAPLQVVASAHAAAAVVGAHAQKRPHRRPTVGCFPASDRGFSSRISRKIVFRTQRRATSVNPHTTSQYHNVVPTSVFWKEDKTRSRGERKSNRKHADAASKGGPSRAKYHGVRIQ